MAHKDITHSKNVVRTIRMQLFCLSTCSHQHHLEITLQCYLLRTAWQTDKVSNYLLESDYCTFNLSSGWKCDFK